MIARAMALAAGLTGAAGLSQFPEFSQQYTQRLGGAVDELSRRIDGVAARASAEGAPLAEYLEALAAEGPRANSEAEALRADIARHARLSADLQALRDAGPFSRARLAARAADPQIARATLDDYRPAIPATAEGAAFAVTGFVLGSALLAILVTLLRGMAETARAPFRRRT